MSNQRDAIPEHLMPREGELIMFENPVLERLSRISPWTVLAIYLPASVALFWLALRAGMDWRTSAVLFLAGLVFWTLFEYLMHRFVFHFWPTSEWQKKLQFTMHGVHHQYPNDKDRLVMPITVSIPLSVLLVWGFVALLGADGWAFSSGFVAGYLGYDMIHYSVHHWTKMKNPLMRAIRRHHMAHHFRDTNKGYGVSTPPWDSVFRTHYQKS